MIYLFCFFLLILNSFWIQIERDSKIGKLALEIYVQQKVEILIALRKLGDSLLTDEINFLQNNASDALKEFEKVTDEQSEYLLIIQIYIDINLFL